MSPSISNAVARKSCKRVDAAPSLWRWPARFCLGLALTSVVACGLTVTNKRPSFEDLQQEEKGAVETILEELTAFNGEVERTTEHSIAEALDRDRIDVSFRGLIFAANFGDDVMHISTWENLTEKQRELVRSWFESESLDLARQTYRKFFYEFLAVSQGVKEYMYQVHSAEWIFANRSLFNVERDGIRTGLAHYEAVGRRDEMWQFVEQACAPIRRQYDDVYGPSFGKQFLKDNFQSLADPENPTGYMYYFCRWYEIGANEAFDLPRELAWIEALE